MAFKQADCYSKFRGTRPLLPGYMRWPLFQEGANWAPTGEDLDEFLLCVQPIPHRSGTSPTHPVVFEPQRAAMSTLWGSSAPSR
jgi:hypothetical protein